MGWTQLDHPRVEVVARWSCRNNILGSYKWSRRYYGYVWMWQWQWQAGNGMLNVAFILEEEEK